MADFTTTYGVNSGGEVDVICHADGMRRIEVQEAYSSSSPATTDLLQRGRISTSAQITVLKGTSAEFTSGPYSLGQKVGTIETVSGSITVQQIESREI